MQVSEPLLPLIAELIPGKFASGWIGEQARCSRWVGEPLLERSHFLGRMRLKILSEGHQACVHIPLKWMVSNEMADRLHDGVLFNAPPERQFASDRSW